MAQRPLRRCPQGRSMSRRGQMQNRWRGFGFRIGWSGWAILLVIGLVWACDTTPPSPTSTATVSAPTQEAATQDPVRGQAAETSRVAGTIPTPAQIPSLTPTFTPIPSPTLTPTPTLLYTFSYAHAYSHAYANSLSHAYANSLSHAHAYSLSHTHAYSISHTHAYSIAHADAYSLAHAHAHSLSHTHAYPHSYAHPGHSRRLRHVPECCAVDVVIGSR